MLTKSQIKLIQKKLQYKFHKHQYLIEALTHTSYVNENPKLSLKSNETLEFLGDSVLGLVIAESLYRKFPNFSEGRLSIMKSTLVSELVLAELATELGIGDYLILGKGEDRSSTRTRQSVLSNLLEAIIGSIYLDGGLKAASKFIHRIYVEKLKVISNIDTFGSYKNRLQHYTQTEFGCMPVYTVVSEKGPSHNRTYEVTVGFNGKIYGRGKGTSKKRAEQEAAREALIALGLGGN